MSEHLVAYEARLDGKTTQLEYMSEAEALGVIEAVNQAILPAGIRLDKLGRWTWGCKRADGKTYVVQIRRVK